jgi:hypothetical protein
VSTGEMYDCERLSLTAPTFIDWRVCTDAERMDFSKAITNGTCR